MSNGRPAERLTQMLALASDGDVDVRAEVIPLIYQQLHRLASLQMSRERRDHTMQATELVNQAYIKLFEGAPIRPKDRNHFYHIAAQQMRCILVDHARRGSFHAIEVPVDELFNLAHKPDRYITDLDESLKLLEKEDPDAAAVVELRFFGGYTEKQVAEILGTNLMRVRRDWDYAKAWLYNRLTKS